MSSLRRRPAWSAAVASPADCPRDPRCLREIVVRVPVEILGGNSILARRRFACQREVTLEYLVGAAADLDIGPLLSNI
jgi:hypothetical protein